MILKIMLITVVLIAIAFAAIGIKMFLKKGGKFEKQCSTVNPKTGKRLGCSCGAGDGGSSCKNE
ncbi:MAG: hypothetical protein K8R41_11220 [Bacteroidales bacterium]|nr:hypothetical protein [Bacteroidales bacterium]